MSEPSLLLNLKWILQKPTLSSALVELKQSEPDVTLLCCDGQLFHENKIALSAASPFFYSIIKDFDQSPNPVKIILPEISSTHLELLLNFINTGETTIDRDNLDMVLVLAKQLQIQCFSETVLGDVTAPGEGSDTEVVESEPVSAVDTNVVETGDDDSNVVDGPVEKDEGDIITELEYQQMKAQMFEENLIKTGGCWKCSLCNKRWNEDTRKSRDHSRRHMESHIPVSFQCLGCKRILKTKKSLYYHRNNYCKNLFQYSSTPGYIIKAYLETKEE